MVLIVQSVLVNRNIRFSARKQFHVRYLMDISDSCQILWVPENLLLPSDMQ